MPSGCILAVERQTVSLEIAKSPTLPANGVCESGSPNWDRVWATLRLLPTPTISSDRVCLKMSRRPLLLIGDGHGNNVVHMCVRIATNHGGYQGLDVLGTSHTQSRKGDA